MHLKQHGMDLSDYKVSYGEPVVVKNKYHKCHICDQIFVFTRSRLERIHNYYFLTIYCD